MHARLCHQSFRAAFAPRNNDQRRLLGAAVRWLGSLFLGTGFWGSHLCRCLLEKSFNSLGWHLYQRLCVDASAALDHQTRAMALACAQGAADQDADRHRAIGLRAVLHLHCAVTCAIQHTSSTDSWRSLSKAIARRTTVQSIRHVCDRHTDMGRTISWLCGAASPLRSAGASGRTCAFAAHRGAATA